MQFLAPLFFVALAGLAIPVLLHLTQREKKQIIRFPSLMFVRRIPYQSVRRRKIQHWLLLAVRMAALALIIFAFARPFLRQADLPVVPGAGARELVVLLDTSYSMGFADRWERARAAAQEQIKRMGGDGVKVLAYYRPDAAPEVIVHQQAFVRTVGAACRRFDLPFVLELLVHPLAGAAQDPIEDPARRAELVLESVRTFAAPEFEVDLLKLESPVAASALPDPEAAEAFHVKRLVL